MLSNLFSTRMFLLLMLISISFYGCGTDKQIKRSESSHSSWEAVSAQGKYGVPVDYVTVGTVVSDQRVEVSSKLTGYIQKIFVKEGDKVRMGEMLASIDSREVDSVIRQAEAAVATASAAHRDAETDLSRYEALFQRGSISENEIRKMRLRFETASESLKQAEAGLSSAMSIKKYAELRSTIDGVVISKFKQPGDLTVPGAPILTLEVKDGYIIETFVAESRIADIHVNDPVSVDIDGINEKIEGHVQSIVNVADPVTRSCLVKISLPPAKGLRLGMFSRVIFNTGTADTIYIPAEALVERGGLKGVFVINGENKIKFRWLRTGRESGSFIEVVSGLSRDERIVATANSNMKDGDIVSLVQ